MRVARRFAARAAPYEGIRFRGLCLDSSSVSWDIEVPETWPDEIAAAWAEGALQRDGVPARLRPRLDDELPDWLAPRRADEGVIGRLGPETSARQAVDRLAGALTWWGWRAGYFDATADAESFFDDLRFLLIRRVVVPDLALWRATGAHWAYGRARPAEPRYAADFRTGTVIEAGATHTTCAAGASGARDVLVLPEALHPAATIDLAWFVDPSGRFDGSAFAQAIHLCTLALDISLLCAAWPSRRRAAEIWRDRPVALSLANFAGFLMAQGVAYDSDHGRGLCAAAAALCGATAWAGSAEMAQEFGPCPAFATRRVELLGGLARLADVARAAVGEIGPADAAATPAAALAMEARLACDRAFALARIHGLRNTVTRAQEAPRSVRPMLSGAADALAPLPAVVRYRRHMGGALRKEIDAAALNGLGVLGHGPDRIARVFAHALGHGTLADAPGVNHAALEARGFGAAEFAAIERALAHGDDIRHAFNRLTLGEAFCRDRLGLDEVALAAHGPDLLPVLGFSDHDIARANAHCFGHGTLDDAPTLRAHERAVFAAGAAIGLRARLAMRRAVTPFIGAATADIVAVIGVRPAALGGTATITELGRTGSASDPSQRASRPSATDGREVRHPAWRTWMP